MIKTLGGIALTGAAAGSGITALVTRNSENGDGAIGTAKGLGIAAGVTGALGIGALMAAKGGQGALDEFINLLVFGGTGVVLTGAAAGLGGAAAGTALVGAARN